LVVEMDLGIICGCLSGVKPVLVAVFPAIFGNSHRSRSEGTRPSYVDQTSRRTHESFHPLSDLSSKAREKYMEDIDLNDVIEIHQTKPQRNFAWASSNGDMRADSEVPPNSIAVNHVVTVVEEGSGVMTPNSNGERKLSDAGSEEWIMEGPEKV
jgi:hypothetical protein